MKAQEKLAYKRVEGNRGGKLFKWTVEQNYTAAREKIQAGHMEEKKLERRARARIMTFLASHTKETEN